MNDSDKLDLLDECIKLISSAKLCFHKDKKSYAVDLGKARISLGLVFETLKEESELRDDQEHAFTLSTLTQLKILDEILPQVEK